MKKKSFALILILVLVFVLSLSLVACKDKNDDDDGGDEFVNDRTVAGTTIVVSSSEFSGKFNPFFYRTAYDGNVADLTQSTLIGVDRNGEFFLNGIDGTTTAYQGVNYTYYSLAKIVETQENGKYVYTITLRDNVKFSDGKVMDIDDLIFTMYVLSDPTYTGSSTFYTLPIEGMQAYYKGSLDFSSAALKEFLENNGEEYADEYKEVARELIADEYAWCKANLSAFGFETTAEMFTAFYGADGWDVDGAPTEDENAIADYFINLAVESYWNDPGAFDDNYGGAYLAPAIDGVTKKLIVLNADAGATAANISGIVRLSNNSLKVVLTEQDAAIYSKLSLFVAPLHYYGSEAQYDYANNKFGFTKGNLDAIEANNVPVGCGPYTYQSFTNGVVTMKANDYYYKGAPYVQYLQFKEMDDSDIISGIANGTIDSGEPSYNVDTVSEIKGHNSNGEVNGNKINVKTMLNLGYGYIGICAQSVNVDDEPGSDASKNLRKAYATLFAVYRELAYDSYYADAATVIEYPISNTSWAAPLPTDNGYKRAYSVDVNGDPIYTDGMTAEQKYAAALDAAKGFLTAAGFTYNSSTGKFTDVPTFTAVVPGAGKGDHPNFAVLSNAAAALDTIGIELIIDDRSSTATLWTDIEAGTIGFWTAAWQATVDPDMYQIYHSNNIVGAGGTDSNHYGITDEDLDDLIMEGRSTTDRTTRKNIYKEAMEIVLDWGVEIPAYQRLNAYIFSSERVDVATVCTVSSFYSWLNEIENVKMK